MFETTNQYIIIYIMMKFHCYVSLPEYISSYVPMFSWFSRRKNTSQHFLGENMLSGRIGYVSCVGDIYAMFLGPKIHGTSYNIIKTNLYQYDTLWLFNIAIENCHLVR